MGSSLNRITVHEEKEPVIYNRAQHVVLMHPVNDTKDRTEQQVVLTCEPQGMDFDTLKLVSEDVLNYWPRYFYSYELNQSFYYEGLNGDFLLYINYLLPVNKQEALPESVFHKKLIRLFSVSLQQIIRQIIFAQEEELYQVKHNQKELQEQIMRQKEKWQNWMAEKETELIGWQKKCHQLEEVVETLSNENTQLAQSLKEMKEVYGVYQKQNNDLMAAIDLIQEKQQQIEKQMQREKELTQALTGREGKETQDIQPEEEIALTEQETSLEEEKQVALEETTTPEEVSSESVALGSHVEVNLEQEETDAPPFHVWQDFVLPQQPVEESMPVEESVTIDIPDLEPIEKEINNEEVPEILETEEPLVEEKVVEVEETTEIEPVLEPEEVTEEFDEDVTIELDLPQELLLPEEQEKSDLEVTEKMAPVEEATEKTSSQSHSAPVLQQPLTDLAGKKYTNLMEIEQGIVEGFLTISHLPSDDRVKISIEQFRVVRQELDFLEAHYDQLQNNHQLATNYPYSLEWCQPYLQRLSIFQQEMPHQVFKNMFVKKHYYTDSQTYQQFVLYDLLYQYLNHYINEF